MPPGMAWVLPIGVGPALRNPVELGQGRLQGKLASYAPGARRHHTDKGGIMTRKFRLLAVGVLGATAALAANAEDIRPGQERFEVLLGAFLPAFDSDVRVDGDTENGNRINLGDDFGVNRDETGYLVGLGWRFKEK